MRDNDPERNRLASDRVRNSVQAYLQPILLVVLGTILWSAWTRLQIASDKQAEGQQQVLVVLTQIQDKLGNNDVAVRRMQKEITEIVNLQADHEHRITLLESKQADDNSTGHSFRPGEQ